MLVNRKEDIFEIKLEKTEEATQIDNPEKQAAKTKKIYKKRNTAN